MRPRDEDPERPIIAGGGVGGLAAALANQGYEVTVLEQAREYRSAA